MTEMTIAADTPQKLAALDTPSLRAELGRALRVTAESLVYLAAIWHELENRGEDLASLRTGLSAYLPLIASGRADPQAVVAFAGQPTLLRAIIQLPIAEQQRLAAGGTITIVIQTPEGEEAQREVSPTLLSAAETRRVFAPGVVRSPAEQSRMLRVSRGRARRLPPPSQATMRVAQIDLAPLGADTRQTNVLLSPHEHEALKIAAARVDLPIRDFIRRLIVSVVEE
jgi:hypothetical protein